MPQIIDLGKIRFSYKGVYSASVQYVQNDVVTYGANAYVYTNTTASTGNTPTNTTYWSVMTAGLQFEGNWSNGTSYQANDIVTFGGKSYVALRDTVADVPSTSPSDWDLLNDGIRHMGPWAASASYYYPGDVVTRGGSQYIALTYHEPTASFATDLGDGDWAEFTRGTRFRGPWTTNTVYLKDDIVNDGVNTQIATLDFTSNPVNFASETGGYWVEYTAGSDEIPSQLGKQDYLFSTDGTDPFWTNSINLSGSAVIGGETYVGASAFSWTTASAALTNPNLVIRHDTGTQDSSFAQVAFNNADPTSSTDIIAYMDNGNDSEGWIGMGIAGSQFDDTTYGITGPGDGYIFHNAISGSGDTGNLVLATGANGTQNRIVFAAGGFDSGLEQMIIIPDTQVHIEIATESTSPTTGALRVAGGAGISGNMNILGNLRVQGSVEVFGGVFETETLVSSVPLFSTGTGATNDIPDRGFLVETKVPSSSASFAIGQVSASGGVGTVVRKQFTGLTRARTGGTATITIQEASHDIQIGETIVLSNFGAPYDGTQTVTGIGGTTIQFAAAGTESATADTDGIIKPNIPSQFVNGDSIIIANCDRTAFNGQRNFVKTVSANTLTFDLSATQTPVSASGTVTVNTKTVYDGLIRDSANDQWYLIANHPTSASGSLRLAPTDTINLGSAGLTYPTLNIGNLVLQNGSTLSGNITLYGNNTYSGTATFSSTTALSGGGSLAGTFTGNPTLSGNPTFSGNPVFSGAPSFSGTPVFTGGVRVQEMIEDVIDVSQTSNSVTLDYTAGNIFYQTNQFTAAGTVNITNAPTDNGRVFTVTFITPTANATTSRPTTLNINGAAQTIKWNAGIVPDATTVASKIDIWTFTVIRRSNTYEVLGAANLNF